MSKRESAGPAPEPEGSGAKSWASRKKVFKGVQLYRDTATRLVILAKAEGYKSIADYLEAIAGGIIEDKWQDHLTQGRAERRSDPKKPPPRRNRAG